MARVQGSKLVQYGLFVYDILFPPNFYAKQPDEVVVSVDQHLVRLFEMGGLDDFRRECARLGIGSSGTRAELELRLSLHMNRKDQQKQVRHILLGLLGVTPHS